MGSTIFSDASEEARRLLEAIFHRTSKWASPTGMSVYQPQHTDVVIATYPKAGTTLLQNMAYQIAVATGGAPSFDPDGTAFCDITEVAPWVEYGPEFGVLECDTSPRIFKTHGRAQTFDLGKATYIYCIRDPEDYPASWLNFLFDTLSSENVTDDKVREEVFHFFVQRKLLGYNYAQTEQKNQKEATGLGPWFTHVKEWIDAPQDNIVILFYEDIVRDLRGTVLCVARFMNRTLSPEGLETVVQRCELGAMAGNPKFNCGFAARTFGFPPTAEKAIPKDRPGFKKFKIKEQDMLVVNDMMKEAFGVNSYKELQSLIRTRPQARFPNTVYEQ